MLIKSRTDGERLREQIRQDRERIKRHPMKIVAEVEVTLREASRQPRSGARRNTGIINRKASPTSSI